MDQEMICFMLACFSGLAFSFYILYKADRDIEEIDEARKKLAKGKP